MDTEAIYLLSVGLKSEDGYSSKQTVFGRDAKGEPPWMGLRRVCVDYVLPAVTKLATGVQGSSLVVSMIANLFAANSKNLSCNKKHLWAGESYSPEVILPEQRFSQTLVLELTLNKKLESYGVTAVERPKIKATKKLDLSGDLGRQIILSETKLTLRTHQKTFKKLADM